MPTKKGEASITIICQIKGMKCFDADRKTIKSFSKTIKYTKTNEKIVRAFMDKIAKISRKRSFIND